MKKKKIVFTGGHHTSAVAVIDEIAKKQELANKVQVHFIGHRYAMHQEKIESAEYQEIKKRRTPFYDLQAGKIYRTLNLWEWLRVPYGFFQALFILLKVRPALIVSFGGYLAVPVVFAGWLLGIPAVTHEQTVTVGWANKFIAYFAKKVFISWSQSRKFFPEEKVIFTGLPLRQEIVALAREGFEDLANDEPVLYITGGKQGSQVINQAVEDCLQEFLDHFYVYHQTGALDLPKFRDSAKDLPTGLKEHYTVFDYYGQKRVAEVYKKATVVVGRAGAHTTYELAVLGKPAVLIPIPWASHNEQEKNARILEEVELAKILPQKDLDGRKLLRICLEQASLSEAELRESRNTARELVQLDAAQKIVEELLEYLS